MKLLRVLRSVIQNIWNSYFWDLRKLQKSKENKHDKYLGWNISKKICLCENSQNTHFRFKLALFGPPKMPKMGILQEMKIHKMLPETNAVLLVLDISIDITR